MPTDIGLDIITQDEAAKATTIFLHPEAPTGLGPIEEIDDKFLGRKMRVRELQTSMLRGAESKMKVLCYLDPMPHMRLEKPKPLQGWYQPAHTTGKERSRPRPCFTEAVLTEPYGGTCPVQCGFCYINQGSRGYRATGLTTVPLNYGEYVGKTLDKMRTSAAGYFTSFHEPFNPLENLYHNTEQGAKAFVDRGIPIFFLSRLKYPEWAIELLQQNKYSYAQKSLNTGVDEDYLRFSPGALPLHEHLDQIADLRQRGIYTSIQVNPILPGITDHDHIRLLFERLAQVDNNHVIVKFVEASFSWVPGLETVLEKRFGPDRSTAFSLLFTQNIGGQRTIEEDYRIKAHHLYRRWATELGMTYATCYEYRYSRNEDNSITNKIGVSVGREFTTSDQCHGHRVPMFTRETLDESFHELLDCPPGGCLHCAKENGGMPRCGDLLFGNATALKLTDFARCITRQEQPHPASAIDTNPELNRIRVRPIHK